MPKKKERRGRKAYARRVTKVCITLYSDQVEWIDYVIEDSFARVGRSLGWDRSSLIRHLIEVGVTNSNRAALCLDGRLAPPPVKFEVRL
jgi:hypothetical protein